MNLELDPTSSAPLHQQAEDLLRRLIREDEYANGKRLPNEVELAKELNISRNTLRQAINKLVYEGLLVRKKSYGTTVAPPKVTGNARNWMSFSQEMKAMGIAIENFELHISKKKATTEVSDFFRCAAGMRLLCLERLRGRPEQPFVYFISYFNPEIPMSGNEDFNAPLYEMLRINYRVEVKTSKEIISAQKANPWLAEKLGIEEGEPVLVRKRFVLDVNGNPVEYNIGYYRPDCFSYSIEFVNE